MDTTIKTLAILLLVSQAIDTITIPFFFGKVTRYSPGKYVITLLIMVALTLVCGRVLAWW